jgi:hypothetical protein
MDNCYRNGTFKGVILDQRKESYMKRNIALVLAGIVVISFFLPWVSVDAGLMSGLTAKISKVIKVQEQKMQLYSISGFKVPILANSKESRVMITIIKIFEPNITNADKKSYLIWIIPILAIAMFLAGDFFKNNKWVFLGIGITGLTISLGATLKIMMTNLDKVALKINIGYGFWLVLIGYLGLAVLGIIKFLELHKNKS